MQINGCDPRRARPCGLCAGADPDQATRLDELVPPGRSRFVAITPRFAAVPTFGCYVPGYLLIVPRAHVLSFGHLDAAARTEAEDLVGELAARLQDVYALPVLGFEYGLSVAGVRRIEHAHWHLLPSPADLNGWLDTHLPGRPLTSFADLPTGASYIAVRGQDARLGLYDVGRDAAKVRAVHQRIRLRRAVAALDPRVTDAAWDWAEHRFAELIRATVTDLGTLASRDPRAERSAAL